MWALSRYQKFKKETEKTLAIIEEEQKQLCLFEENPKIVRKKDELKKLFSQNPKFYQRWCKDKPFS